MTVKSEASAPEKKESLYDLVIVLLQAVAIAVVVKTFLFQPFNIPTPSMVPTLLVGDYLFVSKFSYGYSKYSFPFSFNLFSGRILGSEPKRGDVIVFRLPSDTSKDYIKRLIGLPGDTVQIRNGVVHVNGQPFGRERIEDVVEDDKRCGRIRVPQYRETNLEGRSYITQKLSESPDCTLYRAAKVDNTEVFRVPEDSYFMMGDNRDNSADSRISPDDGGVGFVPSENLIGRARFLFFSIDESASWFAPWRWLFEIRYSRVGNTIH